MEQNKMTRRFSDYNNIIKEYDQVYRDTAKTLGLPECAFWILYTLRSDGGALTQSQICDSLYQPKQTVNSALKKLESEGYIELLFFNDRRSKQLRLTEKGVGLAEKTVDRVIAAEMGALSGLSDAEQETFIRLLRRHTDLLKEKMKNL